MTTEQGDTIISLLTTIQQNMGTGYELQVLLSWLGFACLLLSVLCTIQMACLLRR